MNFPLIADASPEIETWKMIVTLAGVSFTAGATIWNLILSARIKRKEQNYGAQISKALREHESEMNKQEAEFESSLSIKVKEYEAKLQHFTFENQTKFAQLHTDRVKVVLEFHQAFLDTAAVLEHLQNTDEGLQKVYDDFGDVSKKLWKLHRDKKLYFPKKLADTMEEMLDVLDKAAYSRTIEHNYPLTGKQIEISAMITDLRRRVELSQEALENEFRKLLGVSIEEEKSVESS